MALTITDVKEAKPLKRNYKLADEKGLYLYVSTQGERNWKFTYRFNERNKVISLGTYPEVDLPLARELRDEARELIADGIDPVTRCYKKNLYAPTVETFQAVAEDWLERVYRFEVSEEQFKRTRRQLEQYIISNVGKRLVSDITPEDLKGLASALGAETYLDRSKRLLGKAGKAYKLARDTSVAGYQRTATLRQRLTRSGTEPEFMVTTRDQITQLAFSLLSYWGRTSSTAAMKLSVWLLAKPSEIVNARWSDMDLDSGEWRIRRKDPESDTGYSITTVPLPRQAVELLREMEPLTGRHEFIFSSQKDDRKPLAVRTLTGAVKRLGRHAPVSNDKLREMAANALGELGYQAEQIQAQLLNQPAAAGNDRGAERESQARRREMLQAWADYLDDTLSAVRRNRS